MGSLLRILTLPFQWIARLLGFSTRIARGKSAASAAASGVADATHPSDFAEEEAEWHEYARSLQARPSGGLFGWLTFAEFRRPDADEMRPSELNFEAGKLLANEATKFFNRPVDLFEAPGSWLYEQVEREYIRRSYSGEGSKSDRKFIFTMRRFRKLVNANTAKMFLLHVPLTAAIAGLLSHFAMEMIDGQMALSGVIGETPDSKPQFERLKAEPTGDVFLDHCLDILEAKKKGFRRKPADLVSALANARGFLKPLQDQLVALGMVKRQTQKVLFFFNREVYPQRNGQPEAALISHLRQIIQSDAPVDERDIILIALAEKTGLLKRNLGADVVKARKQRIQDIIETKPLSSKAAQDAIEAMEAAMLMVIVAASAGSVASG
jgi:hypothetical protein